MAADFRSAGTHSFTANNVANPFTCSPGAPAGVAVGDVLVLICDSRSITATVATPSGWTLVTGFPKRSATASGGTFYAFTRTADGTASDTPSPVWSGLTTGTSGDSSGAMILAFTGITETLDGTVQASDLASQTGTSVIPAFTTATDGSIVVGLAMKLAESSGQTSVVTGFTEATDDQTTSGTGHTIESSYKVVATHGSSGTATVNWSNLTSARALTASFGLQPITAVDGNASGSIPTLTLTGVSGGAVGGAAAIGSVPTLTLSAATAAAVGSASASGAFPTLTLSPVSGGAAEINPDGSASGSFPTLTLSAVSGSAVGSAAASGALPTLSLAAPTATATGGAATTGALGTLTLSSVSGSAIGGAAATGATGTLSLSAVSGGATGSASATGGFGTLTLSPVAGSADAPGAGDATATGGLGTLTLSALAGTATGDGVASGALGTLTLGPLAAMATGGALGIGALDTLVLTAPDGSAREIVGAIGGPPAVGRIAGESEARIAHIRAGGVRHGTGGKIK